MVKATFVTASRELPRQRVSFKKLEKSIRSDWYEEQLALLPSGTVIVLKAELGFMEMLYHVTTYEPEPNIFNPSRLSRVSLESFDGKAAAQKYFKQLTTAAETTDPVAG